jgi:2-polyprenyl-3-methyl-5-hydroxy-6-metoxy-1,4-benzoquinol methylase
MAIDTQKRKYFVNSLFKMTRGLGLECPSCGSAQSTTVDKKMLVTRLVRCSNCQLQFRIPTTTKEENKIFYQEEYTQGFTTDVPSDEELARMKVTSFKDTDQDFSTYLSILEAIGAVPGQRVLDFGCSWGYGTWQMQQRGFDLVGFEISEPRCRYAREKVGVQAFDTLDQIQGTFDIFFSAHVLEHVPSVQDSIAYAWKVLNEGGLLVAFTPNGSQAYKDAHPDSWHKLWGLVHPQFLDAIFYKSAFAHSGYLLASNPYNLDQLRSWDGKSQAELNLSGMELLVAVKKTNR